MRRLLGYMRPYRKQALLSIGFLIVNSLVQVTGPMLTKVAIDRYLAPKGAGGLWPPLDRFLSSEPATGLAQISLLYAAALLFGLFT